MDSSLSRNNPHATQTLFFYSHLSPLFLRPLHFRPWKARLMCYGWVSVFWSPLRGKAYKGQLYGVQWLKGSSVLAKTQVPTANALHLFMLWVLQNRMNPNSVHTRKHTFTKDETDKLVTNHWGQGNETVTRIKHICTHVNVDRQASQTCSHARHKHTHLHSSPSVFFGG